jgi:hypothetical protein
MLETALVFSSELESAALFRARSRHFRLSPKLQTYCGSAANRRFEPILLQKSFLKGVLPARGYFSRMRPWFGASPMSERQL